MADPVVYYDFGLFKLGRGDGPDAGRDALLVDALFSGARAIETYCGGRIFYRTEPRAVSFRVRDRVVVCEDGDELLVDDMAAAPSLVEVRHGRRGTWTPVTSYDLEPDDALVKGLPARSLLADAGTWGVDRVRITTEWGFPDTPQDIREANRLLSNRLYLRKDSPDGTSGVGEWGPVRVAASDPDVRALLESWRLESAG